MPDPATPPRRPAARPERRFAGIMLRIMAVTTFAAMAAAIKLASARGVSLVEIIFARSLFSLPLLIAWISLGPGWRTVRTRRPMAHLTRAGIGLSSMVLNFLALILLPLADATTIGFSAPLFATILSALVLREHVGPHRWAAVAVGFAGVIVVMQPGGTPLPPIGIAIALAAAIGVGTVTVTIRQISATETVAALVFWFNLTCLVGSGLLMPVYGAAHPGDVWLLLAVIGTAGGAAQICLTGSLRLAPVAVVAPFDYVQLLWAVALGWAIWATPPAPNLLAGAALIVASGLYTVWREHRLHRDRLPATPPDQ